MIPVEGITLRGCVKRRHLKIVVLCAVAGAAVLLFTLQTSGSFRDCLCHRTPLVLTNCDLTDGVQTTNGLTFFDPRGNTVICYPPDAGGLGVAWVGYMVLTNYAYVPEFFSSSVQGTTVLTLEGTCVGCTNSLFSEYQYFTSLGVEYLDVEVTFRRIQCGSWCSGVDTNWVFTGSSVIIPHVSSHGTNNIYSTPSVDCI